MHFHFPKPMNGWREFLGEVGIIVLGVLVALALEQLAQSWEWRQRAAAALQDLQDEYGGDDGPQAWARVAIHDCLDARYVNLRDAVVSGNGPAIRAALPMIDFPGRSYDDQSFQGAIAAGVVPHMDFGRWRYVRAVYSAIPNLNERARSERMLLAEVRAIYPVADRLDGNARFSTLRAIEQLRELNNRVESSADWMMMRAQDAGFSIEREPLATELRDYAASWGRCMVDPGKRSAADVARMSQQAPSESMRTAQTKD